MNPESIKGDPALAGLQDRTEARMADSHAELLEIARRLSLATDEGDDAAQGTHYVDKAGVIRCKGSFLELIEQARAALARATQGDAK